MVALIEDALRPGPAPLELEAASDTLLRGVIQIVCRLVMVQIGVA
jgi:hypothetical protein